MTVTADTLVTRQDVADQLNDSSLVNSTEIDGYISAASQAVQFDPEYGVGPIAPMDVTETHDGGSHQIVLDQFPVLSVASLSEYCGTTGQVLTAQPLDPDTVFDANGYRLDMRLGLITRWSNGTPTRFAQGTQNILITYTAGRTITGDLRMAVLVLIQHMWDTQQGRNPLNLDQMYPAALWPNRVRELLGQYRRGPIVA